MYVLSCTGWIHDSTAGEMKQQEGQNHSAGGGVRSNHLSGWPAMEIQATDLICDAEENPD